MVLGGGYHAAMKKSLILKGSILVPMSFAASIGMGACGGNVIVDGGGPGEGSFWIAYCNARASACGISAEMCKSQEACARGLLRDQIEDTLLNCLKTECDQGTCVAQIEATFGVTQKGDQYD